MKRNLATSSPNSVPRCTHTSPSGRRCRSSASSLESRFCPRHRPKEDPAAALVRDLQDFRSVSDVTVFLSRLLGVLSRDEISTRRAAVPPTSPSPSCTPSALSSANTKPWPAQPSSIRFPGLGKCLVLAFLVSRTFMMPGPFTPSNTPTICARKRKSPWPKTASNRTFILTASISNPKKNPAKNRLSQRKLLFWPLIEFAHEHACHLHTFGCQLPAYGLRLSATGCQFSTTFPPLWITNQQINKITLDIKRN
jgi:hypothetical protein